MFRNYLKTAFRQLLRNKLFTTLNLLGLSTGLASVMLLAVLVYQYLTTNSAMRDIGQMYYLKTKTPDGNEHSLTPYPLLGEIVKSCPEVEAATHTQQWYYPWLKYGDREFQETTTFADTGYFDVFRLPFKFGDPASALKEKFSVVLSEEVAEKFFGNQNPTGRIMIADDTMQLVVTGVLKHIPSNNTERPVVLLPVAILQANSGFRETANWYNTFSANFLRLRKDADPKTLDAKIAGLVRLNYAEETKNNKVFAVPFVRITDEGPPITATIIKASIAAGVFIILIILINLINLNTAGMYTRSKEVAVRQMFGGSKANIIVQFCIENGLIILISMILAWLLFATLLLPNVSDLVKNNFGEIESGLAKDYPLILLFAGIGTLVTIFAASSPALKLTALKMRDAMKGRITSGTYKSSGMRNIFITVQFALAITLICITVIFNRQISFMKNTSLGFDKENVAVIKLDMAFRDRLLAASGFERILNSLKNNPHVKGVSTTGVVPTAYDHNYNNYYDPVTKTEVSLRQAATDAGYVNTYQIPLIQGKNFDDRLTASQHNSVIINRSALKAFGWKNAVGKQLRAKGETQAYTVVGVMEDFHYQDLQSGVQPIIHWYNKPSLDNRYLSVRVDAGHMKAVVAGIERDFRTIPAKRGFSYEWMSDKVDRQYTLLEGILKVTRGIALLTVLIASMGMFGLIALFAKQRVKEIGIRKVLGASVGAIVSLLTKDFLILVGVAIVAASAAAWYVMNSWLQYFAYRIEMKWWMFAIGGGIAVLIAAFTISIQTVKAALTNPVKNLRTE